LNASSASQQISIDNLNTTTASLLIETSNLELFSASALISISNLNASSASQQISINALNAETSSYVTETESGSFLLTASFDNGTRNLTFTKGNNTTFAVNIPDVSGSVGNFVTTSSFNAYTASTDSSISQLNANTASQQISIDALNTNSASVNTSITNVNSATASLFTSVNALNTFTASQSTASIVTSITNLNSFTQSQEGVNTLLAGEIDSLQAKTGSYATTGSNNFIGDQNITGNITAFSASFTYLQTIFESSSIIYSSGSNQFGDELSDVQTLSGSVKVQGSLTVNGTPVLTSSADVTGFVTTASFNAYTQSNDQRVSSLESNSASVNTSITNINSTTASLNTSVSALNTFTASQSTASLVTSIDNLNTFTSSANSRLNNLETTSASLLVETQNLELFSASALISISNLNAATSSYVTSAITASSLVTASFSGNTLTFTKGDASTFGVVIPDVSGSAGTTIFEVVYTGENITKGDPLYISGSQGANPVVFKADAADPNKMPVTFVSNETIGVANTTEAIVLGLIEGIDLTGYVAGQSIYVAEGGGWSASLPSGSNSVTQLLGVVTKGGSGGKGLVLNPGPAQLPGLDSGYIWVGGVTNQPTEITTASFASSASFNSYTSSNDQKVNSLITATGSFATTGSNSFIGNQTIAGGLIVSSSTDAVGFSGSTFRIDTVGGIVFKPGTAIDFLGNTNFSNPGRFPILNVDNLAGGGYYGFNNEVDGRIYQDFSGSVNARILAITGSGGSINTGSFATTGSNTFTGNQTISTAGNTQLNIISTGGGQANVEFQAPNANFQAYGDFRINNNGQFGGSGSINITAKDNEIALAADRGIRIGSVNAVGSGIEGGSIQLTVPSGSSQLQLTGSMLVTNTLTVSGNANVNTDLTVVGNTNVGNVNVSDAGGINLQATGSGPVTSYGIVTNPANGDLVINNNPGNGRLITFRQTDARAQIWGGLYLNPIDGGGGVVMTTHSGSLFLTPSGQSSTTTSVLHITSSSPVNNVNLIFKDNNSAGDTILSGSNNIFTNPAAPAAGRKNYIGGNSNLFLNGQVDQLPTITGSAASVSGNTPTMNGNYIAGTQTWAINQAVNTGVHTYNNNMLLGTGAWTFNTRGNTGAVTVSNNVGLTSALVLNSPSRSVAQINAGESGSNALTVTNNSIVGTLVYNGPVSSSVHTISQNYIVGSTTFNLQSGSRALSVGGNIINGGVAINDNTVFAPTLGSNNGLSANNINGTLVVNQRASSSFNILNNNINTWQVSSDFDASSITTAGSRTFVMNGNILFGTQNNNIYVSGSNGAVGFTRGFNNNIFGGAFISASVVANGGDSNMISTIGVGQNLNIVGTARRDASNPTGALETQGSAFFGRFNKEGAGFNTTAEVILAVGTGTSGSAGITRKTGFLIDSGSNTFIEGTLNVSGSSQFNGNTTITGSLILSSSAAIELDVIGNVSVTGSINVNSGSYNGQAVTNITPVSSSLSPVLNIVTMTSAEYALITPDSQTLYIIV
jgi:uncharacterized coiled-coil protein SlyX